MANVSKYTTHRGQLSRSVLDTFTDVTSTAVETIACFAYFGEASRGVDTKEYSRQFEQTVGWFVILPNKYFDVKTNDRILNIYDNKGALVKAEGRVKEVVVYRHPRKGVQFVQVLLSDN